VRSTACQEILLRASQMVLMSFLFYLHNSFTMFCVLSPLLYTVKFVLEQINLTFLYVLTCVVEQKVMRRYRM
jgi:hypothetical protein